jgi:hypothetical protein
MILINKFPYEKYTKQDTNNGRVYNTPSGSLPSVTTILSKTKSKESTESLNRWKQRVGNEEASRITKEASNVGSLIHNIMENLILGKDYDPGNNLIHQQAKNMVSIINSNIKNDVSEIWGSEVTLYYPDLYAGTTDLVGLWKNEPTIMDFKQSNKIKKKEWISDYFLQLAAYSVAHDHLYDTKIKQGCIFMCTRNGDFQLFEIKDSEFEYWKKTWAEKVTHFYEQGL